MSARRRCCAGFVRQIGAGMLHVLPQTIQGAAGTAKQPTISSILMIAKYFQEPPRQWRRWVSIDRRESNASSNPDLEFARSGRVLRSL